jgi:hypothetical protein
MELRPSQEIPRFERHSKGIKEKEIARLTWGVAEM